MQVIIRIDKIEFPNRQGWIRKFGRNVRNVLGKKVGITSRLLPMRAVTWREENLGYEKNLPERDKFQL